MDGKMKKSIIWSFLYLVIEIMLLQLFKFQMETKFLYIGILGLVYILINAFWVKYHRERLFVNGMISYLTVIMVGALFGSYLEVNEAIAIGAAISVIDVLSFTKLGKRTANAKAMSNVNFMSKLIVYGAGKGDALYPTCGIGDYFYFALWLTALCKNGTMLLILGAGLLLGNIINKAIICKLSKKPNYKGLPATIVPFVCVVVFYFLFAIKFVS